MVKLKGGSEWDFSSCREEIGNVYDEEGLTTYIIDLKSFVDLSLETFIRLKEMVRFDWEEIESVKKIDSTRIEIITKQKPSINYKNSDTKDRKQQENTV